MDIIWTIVIGGVIGWVASILMKTDKQQGIIANVLVGILGSWLGSWLAPKLGIAATGEIAAYAIMVAGAVLLIFLLKLLGVFK